MDLTTAFLNDELEEVYMKQPEGFIVKGSERLVCKLKRSIYGLKQLPCCWNLALESYLKKMGFTPGMSDPCLYIASEGEPFIIDVYVSDCCPFISFCTPSKACEPKAAWCRKKDSDKNL